MFCKPPKNTERFAWTKHAIEKMRFYGISETKVKQILARPKRKEEGIAPKTIAAMLPAGSKKRPQEIWIMYQNIEADQCGSKRGFTRKINRIKIISAWRYPGISPVREVPIPEEIREELENS